ncbi:MAG: UDP-N-acetylmuramate dehydrogenase [Chlorobi bacterium]|nr:UDP-N-acetylmuramate dehydrogenase [Chlorobiota bacterium]
MQDLQIPCPFEPDVSLREKSYYRIGGRSELYAMPETLRHLGDLLLWNRERRLPLAVMGRGSNMLFSDDPFPGIVVSMERMKRMTWISPEELFCEAGVENTALAAELLGAGRGGGEWLHRLPGMIGSTIRMNARCFGKEISAVTSSVVVMDLEGRIRWIAGEEVFLGYKQTALMRRPEIVVAAVLRFPCPKPASAIREEMERHEAERLEKHHFDYPSCGSTFKNNYGAGEPSGRIFEDLGFKGMRRGGAEISAYHANFIFNTAEASSSDVLALAARMRNEARSRKGVELDLEVECTGLFSNAELSACGVPSIPSETVPGRAWAGLLWPPDKDISAAGAERVYPETLLRGYLTGYSGRRLAFPEGVEVRIEQLIPVEQAVLNPMHPFLKWSTVAPAGIFPVPSDSERVSSEGDFVDGLWKQPVSELFIGHGGKACSYLEFEMQPSGDWVALRFTAPRKREPHHDDPCASGWEGHVGRFMHEKEGFGMTFSYALLYPFLDRNVLSLQCAASLGDGRYGLFPWWCAADEQPDFHQPGRFFRIMLG